MPMRPPSFLSAPVKDEMPGDERNATVVDSECICAIYSSFRLKRTACRYGGSEQVCSLVMITWVMLSWMKWWKWWRAGRKETEHKQTSGWSSACLSPTDIRKHPFLILLHVNSSLLLLRHNQTVVIALTSTKTWPLRFVVIYNGYGGIFQPISSHPSSHVSPCSQITFPQRMRAQFHVRIGQIYQFVSCTYNKTSIFSFIMGGWGNRSAMSYNPLNWWEGSFMSTLEERWDGLYPSSFREWRLTECFVASLASAPP